MPLRSFLESKKIVPDFPEHLLSPIDRLILSPPQRSPSTDERLLQHASVYRASIPIHSMHRQDFAYHLLPLRARHSLLGEHVPLPDPSGDRQDDRRAARSWRASPGAQEQLVKPAPP